MKILHSPGFTLVPIIAGALLWGTGPSNAAAFKNVQVAQTPPGLTVKELGGKEWKSADLFGKGVTAVVFWATWSPRSHEVLRDLEALRAEIGPDKFVLASVNCEHPSINAADRDLIDRTARELKLSGPVLLDDGLVAFNDYGAMALPSTLVVGGDGKVTFVLSGYPTTMRQDLADAIRKAAGIPTMAEQRPVPEYVPQNHALMYYNMGRQLAGKGQTEKALDQLRIAVERDPAFKKPYVELGLLYKGLGRADEAIGAFQKAKELDAHDHEAAYQVASLSLRAGKFDQAEKLFGDLLAEFPEREEFALGLALAMKYQNRAEDYAKTRDQAAKLSPAAPRQVYEMAGVAESQKDVSVALELYRRALVDSFKTRK